MCVCVKRRETIILYNEKTDRLSAERKLDSLFFKEEVFVICRRTD